MMGAAGRTQGHSACSALCNVKHLVNTSVLGTVAVIISLILSLQPRDEQEPCVGRASLGSREVTGDPGALGLI